MKADERTRLAPAARDGVAAAVDALHRLNLPGLAGHLYPVVHPELPATEADALERLLTVRRLMKASPMVARTANLYLDIAESRLRAVLKDQP